MDEHTEIETISGIADALERLEQFKDAFRLQGMMGRRLRGVSEVEWDGGPLNRGSLLIEQYIRDIGAPIRQGRLSVQAAAIVPDCKMLINPRLAALFTRSFPEVEIIASGALDDAVRQGASAVASFETLGYRLAPSPAALKASFRKLIPDPIKKARFSDRWRSKSKGRPLVGISWASSNKNKDLPTLEDWAAFLTNHDYAYVVLQYGSVKEDLNILKRKGVTVIVDSDVQPLGELDTFAAQVSCLDAIITVSNTTAHMAGALGQNVCTILDDKQHLSWPINKTLSPWYPSMFLIRRGGLAWHCVFKKTVRYLERININENKRSE